MTKKCRSAKLAPEQDTFAVQGPAVLGNDAATAAAFFRRGLVKREKLVKQSGAIAN